MAAILATLTSRVLLQIGDNEPVEVGTIDIPIHATISHEEPARTISTINQRPATTVPNSHRCSPCTCGREHCIKNHPA